MSSERRTLWLVFGAVVLVVGALLLWPRVQEQLAPEPDRALVAIQPEGEAEAVVGMVELPAGTPFQLHAVLEATRRDGTTVYYTEAPALRLPDGPVPTDRLLRWDRPQEIKVLWFTVEGAVPYLELDPDETLDRFRMGEFLRPDWPQAWSIPGSLDPANDDALVRTGARPDNPFGTQRYHVRIELYGPGSRLVPERRYGSQEAAELLAAGEDGAADFPTVVSSLPGALGAASALFGLTQIELAPDSGSAGTRGIRTLTRARLAFSRVTAIGALLSAARTTVEALDWRLISLDADLPWSPAGGGEVAPGSLLRVGDRVVILYRDEGKSGVLDRQDLCFDYARGAAVRALNDVFVGGGEVELASLDG